MAKTFIKSTLVSVRDKIKSLAIISQYYFGKIDRITNAYNAAAIYDVRKINDNVYVNIIEEINRFNLQRLSKQQRKKIKVAFVLYSASMWSCDTLYKLFENDDRFEPYIVISRYSLDSNLHTFPTYEKTLSFFNDKPYRLVTVEEDTPKGKCWESMGSPDIVFYLSPYSAFLPVGINEAYMPARVLNVYIPYSYMLAKAESKYADDGMAISWRHFCDSALYREMLINYCPYYEKNTWFFGYPKMDIYYQPAENTRENIWKIPNGKKTKCIIYAPHHSLRGSHKCTANFSTFDDNGTYMLEYARAHADTTSWIIKPHPNLKMTVLETGLFQTEEAYYDYLREWDKLPNARVVEEATYYDIFKTSDALICDSVSFLAEYQFTGKPLLLLTRPEQQFNEFGEKLSEVLYKVPGDDLEGIDRFIEEVVVQGNDFMQENRRSFFDRYLNYRRNGEPSASEQIYMHIIKEIENA